MLKSSLSNFVPAQLYIQHGTDPDPVGSTQRRVCAFKEMSLLESLSSDKRE